MLKINYNLLKHSEWDMLSVKRNTNPKHSNTDVILVTGNSLQPPQIKPCAVEIDNQ